MFPLAHYKTVVNIQMFVQAHYHEVVNIRRFCLFVCVCLVCLLERWFVLLKSVECYWCIFEGGLWVARRVPQTRPQKGGSGGFPGAFAGLWGFLGASGGRWGHDRNPCTMTHLQRGLIDWQSHAF